MIVMTKNDYELLANELMELEQVPSISEHETEMGKVMKKKLAGKVDKTVFDDFRPSPNVISKKKGTSGKYKLAVDYHIDQIGFETGRIGLDGTIRIKDEGIFLDDKDVSGNYFDIQTPKGTVRATAIDAGARRENSWLRRNYVLKLDDAESRDAVIEHGVASGQQAMYAAKPKHAEGTYKVVGPAIDDRVGATEVLENAKYVAARGGVKSDLMYVGSTQEELGLLGARYTAKNSAKGCDVAIVVDDAFANDSDTRSGKGPVLVIEDSAGKIDPKARYLMEEAAKREGITLQNAVMRGYTTASEYSNAGVSAAALAVPVKYAHTDHETVNLHDVAGAIKILNRAVTDAEEILDSYQRMTESKTYQPVAVKTNRVKR